MGFSVLGLLIVAKEHHGGASITGGIISILLGVTFLMAACLHWKCWDQIQGGFQVEEDPAAAEIASQTRRSRPAPQREGSIVTQSPKTSLSTMGLAVADALPTGQGQRSTF